MKILSVFLFLLISFSARAQFTHPLYTHINSVPVKHNGQFIDHAWAGGLNSAQFSTIDLNFDSIPDLFVYDRSDNRIRTFLAVSDSGQWKWQYAPNYENTFPAGIEYWALLVDYDGDGLKDLFCHTGPGVQVYRNISAPATGMAWELASPELKFESSQPNGTNVLVQARDLPAITDIDNDGDIDILTVDNSKVTWYRNMSMDNTGTPGLGRFVRQTTEWGNFRECGCGNFIFGNLSSCRPSGSSSPMHQNGYALLAADLNGDNVKDLIFADGDCSHLTRFINMGTPASAQLNPNYTVDFPDGPVPVYFDFFPTAYMEDVTFDGKKDLLVAPNLYSTLDDTIADFAQSTWFYSNSGTTASPSFTFSDNDFLQGDMIDRGNGSAAAFADVDGDGDLDMIVGNYYGKTANGSRSSLALYTNEGSAANPSFVLTDPDFLNMSSTFFVDLRPVFADVNGDSKTDLLLTSTTFSGPFAPRFGRILYFLNSGAPGSPMAFGPMQTLDIGITDNVDDVPCFFDIDNDGNQDLLIGSGAGNLKYYRNTGSNSSPVYELVTNTFGGLAAASSRRYLFPAIADTDNDGNPDLITSLNGSIIIYPNFRAQGTVFQGTTSVLNNQVTNSRENPFFGFMVSVAAADLNADGLPELVIGSRAGGLQMLSPDSIVGLVLSVSPEKQMEVSIYPNPATNMVTVEAGVAATVTVTDVLGRPVLMPSEAKMHHQLPVSSLSAGVYLVRLETAQGKFMVKRLVISR